MNPKAILAFDLDGTLTERNKEKILPGGLADLLNRLNDLGFFFVPITGKPAPYVMRVLQANQLPNRGIVAENAGIFMRPDSEMPEVFGSGLEAIKKYKEALGVGRDAKNVVTIIWQGKPHQVVVDPEDVSILTIFTNPETVKHRWHFTQTIGTQAVHQELKQLLVSTGLEKDLELLPPFPDGGIQIIRKDQQSGKPIDKSLLPEVIKIMFATTQELPTAMFGDGHNDIPAMAAGVIIPLTFQNSPEIVKAAVKEKNGYISHLVSLTDMGVVDGMRWLNEKRNFFGEDSQAVRRLLHTFPEAL